MEVFVEFFPGDTACGADGLVQWTGLFDLKVQVFDGGGELGRGVQGFARGDFENEGCFGGIKAEGFAQVIAE